MKTTLLKKNFLTLMVLMTLTLSSINVNAQHTIVFADPLPAATIKEGQTQVVTFTYTSTAENDKYQIRFVRKNLYGNWDEVQLAPIVAVENLPVTPTPTTATASFLVPNDVLTAYPLGENQVYQYAVSMMNSGWGDYIGSTMDVEITSNLATNSFNKAEANILAQNPVGNQLMLNNNDFKSASIFDISGRKVMQFNTVGNNIEVSQLTKGIYFLVSDTNVKAKFLKK